MSLERPIHHAPVTQGMMTASEIVSSTAWEQFFRECRAWAVVARQRRAEKEAVASVVTLQSSPENVPAGIK